MKSFLYVDLNRFGKIWYAGVKGGRVEGQACEDPGARTPISTNRNFLLFSLSLSSGLSALSRLGI